MTYESQTSLSFLDPISLFVIIHFRCTILTSPDLWISDGLSHAAITTNPTLFSLFYLFLFIIITKAEHESVRSDQQLIDSIFTGNATYSSTKLHRFSSVWFSLVCFNLGRSTFGILCFAYTCLKPIWNLEFSNSFLLCNYSNI